MNFIEVTNTESKNTELINLDNVTNIVKLKDNSGVVQFIYGGGCIRISAEDYEKIKKIQ
jgi:hypothetical protein